MGLEFDETRGAPVVSSSIFVVFATVIVTTVDHANENPRT